MGRAAPAAPRRPLFAIATWASLLPHTKGNMTFLISVSVLAGIVAKGLGVLAVIFGSGVLLGVVLTVSLTRRSRRRDR